MSKNIKSTKGLPLVTLSYISENAVLLEWPEKVCAVQHQHIMHCQQQIGLALKSTVIDSIASYASLIIYYKFDQITHDSLNTLLLNVVQKSHLSNENLTLSKQTSETEIEIPVYYGEEAGWDIQTVAQQTQLTCAEVIQYHTQTTYRAYALGFTPGFCYLGELVPRLQLARKSSPRLSVPKGAVAIAEQQTAVYPNTSPGGWHIIGQTPLDMYSVKNNEFESTISVGQSVKFVSITQAEFLSLGGELIKEYV
ncbi:5-oxoprolinase subunit PxpB [Pseudocolwellia agarivorans]|uniref:5-oxoprolinase subunit PxpB n=1 Tax=Pseudocolwellia agarivorans TaxID=1911682 RepID=UPI0009864B1B|nr:5-oxoprolinase subunit PxpB [Pseudocolwellia agarivorans]